MKRKTIANKIAKINSKIDDLILERDILRRQGIVLSDKEQQYKEAEETFGSGKDKKTYLIGRVYWKEFFKDEDYPNNPKMGVWVERSRVVKQDGEFVNGY